jgi:D-arabinose 1-dehydrogenase-like Zn-dependent alcohol dehydrogenase
MSKAVQFDSYGSIDVLQVRDVPRPVPGVGEVLVEVKAAVSRSTGLATRNERTTSGGAFTKRKSESRLTTLAMPLVSVRTSSIPGRQLRALQNRAYGTRIGG